MFRIRPDKTESFRFAVSALTIPRGTGISTCCYMGPQILTWRVNLALEAFPYSIHSGRMPYKQCLPEPKSSIDYTLLALSPPKSGAFRHPRSVYNHREAGVWRANDDN